MGEIAPSSRAAQIPTRGSFALIIAVLAASAFGAPTLGAITVDPGLEAEGALGEFAAVVEGGGALGY